MLFGRAENPSDSSATSGHPIRKRLLIPGLAENVQKPAKPTLFNLAESRPRLKFKPNFTETELLAQPRRVNQVIVIRPE
jgi:hypothetical protein